ncbi:low molecular weight protein-tyrosine-phosphatase [Ferrimonas senticii]|uniref:low molecular weight protein-tyrosine-phosphatase n=1 Tax=Ferrimonas senticii TaxID=394566 RepID=UPI00041E4115|nr:low molecular weight protein-tyrosine-phosphatase [Ferrimonas senticii]
MKFENILIVCVGNICRSPTVELMFKQRWPNKHISSAGVGALVDKPMDATAMALAAEHNFDGTDHRGRQLTAAIAAMADLIIVMEKGHIAAVERIAPGSRGKVFLLGKWQQDLEIPDPYRQSREAFEHVYTLMENSTASWAKVLG